MHLVLVIIFGAVLVAGLLSILRGRRLAAALHSVPPATPRTQEEEIAATRQKALPVLMYVIAVPLIVFGVAGLATVLAIAGE